MTSGAYDSDDLALALVASSAVPTLLLDANLIIVAASASFCDTYEIDSQTIEERELSELGKGEWDVPQLRTLAKGTASGYAKVNSYNLELKRRGRPVLDVLVSVVKLDTAQGAPVRLLMTALDVTGEHQAMRNSEALSAENAMLQRQVQHRVANSLQVIASILLQGTRDLRSSQLEGRLPLRGNDAVAQLSEHLHRPTAAKIEVRPYLQQLCDCLSASMISDSNRLTLDVRAVDGMRDAYEMSMMGLMVTEMVLNAFKHGFTESQRGRVSVIYETSGADWVLSVSDNGRGMRGGPDEAGLGTGIIEAMCGQLQATRSVRTGSSGTSILITHVEAAQLRIVG